MSAVHLITLTKEPASPITMEEESLRRVQLYDGGRHKSGLDAVEGADLLIQKEAAGTGRKEMAARQYFLRPGIANRSFATVATFTQRQLSLSSLI